MVQSFFTLFLLMTLSLASGIATAACDSGLAERMLAQTHPHRAIDATLSDCKSWSTFVGKTIVVLPLQHAVTDRGARTFDVELVVVQRPDNGNTERDQIAARLLMPELLIEDADLRVQELHVDTGRYRLSDGVHAFGLRVLYRGQDPAKPYFAETLRLFAYDRKTIRPVLDELVLRRDSGRWDLSCHGRFEEMRSQFGVRPPAARSSDARAELTVRRTTLVRNLVLDAAGDCQELAEPPSYSTVTLKARNGRYEIPPALRAP